MIELAKHGLSCKSQEYIEVYYKGEKIGKYYADIIVEDAVILELKATPIVEAHELQLFNYLKATEIEVGLLLSFGQTPIVKRKIFTNDRKNNIKKSV